MYYNDIFVAKRGAQTENILLLSHRERLVAKDTVDVDGSILKFKKAVIATGARPMIPPIEGLAIVGFLTNDTVFNLTKRPKHLSVIGGWKNMK